jgi:5-methyltetrahydrofolate--homocysteine methyltransferase
VDGDRKGLDDELAAALAQGIAPLAIINGILLDGMKVVGELFGAARCSCPSCCNQRDDEGRRRLPEPHMERSRARRRAPSCSPR